MSDFKNYLNLLAAGSQASADRPAPRKSLYCIRIRENEGENSPSIRVWIDPAVAICQLQAQARERERATDSLYEPVALSVEDDS
jgi:hypothetical protein